MTANQLNYRDKQDYIIDIDEVYKTYISTIDNIRSYVNILNPNNQKILGSLNIDFFLGAAPTASLKLEQTYQESRCHAFYRLVGFPVVSDPDQQSGIYNPGHDIVFTNTDKRTIFDEQKLKIANGFLKKYKKISDAREQYVINQLAVFSNNNSINAQVLALTGVNYSVFNAPFLKTDTTLESTTDPDKQPFLIPFSTRVGKRDIDFDQFEDVSGKKYENISPERSHIIAPFMVDPRIDLSVSASRKIAVPFVENDSQCQVSSTEYVQKCMLEKIIIDKYTVTDQIKSASTSQKDAINYIKNNTGIQDENLLKQISSNNLYKFSQQQQFLITLNVIYGIVETLVDASLEIDKQQSQYYWLPAPSTIGPEGGSKVNKVFVNLPTILCTQKENFIREKQSEVFLSEILKMSEEAKGIPNAANSSIGYPLAGLTNTYTTKPSDGSELTIQQQLSKSISQRDAALSSASNALRIIEIIMGTFSGFGYCDIIAITGALYLMPKEELLGFLDDNAFQRAKLVIKGLPDTRVTYRQAAATLTGLVSSYYKLMDDVYENVRKSKSL